MTPGEAKRPDTYIVINHPSGGKRYPAHIFDLENGIAWIEYGWAEDDPLSAPSNPVHMAKGKFIQSDLDGQWKIDTEAGVVTVRIMSLSNEQDEEPIIDLSDMNEGDRDRAREVIQSSLDIKLP